MLDLLIQNATLPDGRGAVARGRQSAD